MTVRHLARNNINYMEYVLGRVKPLQKPFVPIEIKKGHYIIDIPVRKTILGLVNGKRNILVFNFFALAFLIENLADGNGWIGICSTSCSCPCLINTTGSGAYIGYGYGTSSPSFSQCSLASPSGSIATQVTIGSFSDRSRITLFGTLPGHLSSSPTEVGIYQDVNNGGGGCGFTTMFGRIVSSFSPGSAVTYYIDFLQPWTYNFAELIYSFLTRTSSVTVISTSGNSFSTNWKSANGASIMIGSVNSYSWSPSLTSITQDVTFSTSHSYQNNISSVIDYILGNVTPSQTITIQTLGLVQEFSGNYILILALPLSSPITLYGGQQNQVSLRLVAE